MTLINSENSLVLIIDVQEKLLNAAFNRETLGKKAEIIAKAANVLNIPVVVTEQYPKGLGATIDSVKNAFADTTQTFEKITFSAFDNENVLSAVKSSGKKQIILFGIETHICVSQTANALIEAGYEVYVVKDACGSRSEDEYRAGLERMKDNGAKPVTCEITLFEWLRGAKHPNFKEVQSLIK